MIRHVQRDKQGQITGSYARLQPGYAEEEIDEDAPEHVAFMARLDALEAAPATTDLAAEIADLKARLETLEAK